MKLGEATLTVRGKHQWSVQIRGRRFSNAWFLVRSAIALIVSGNVKMNWNNKPPEDSQ